MSERRESSRRERSGRQSRASRNQVEDVTTIESPARTEKGGDNGRVSSIPDATAQNSGFTKKCVIPSLALAILLSLAVGAAVFFLIYYILFIIDYCPWNQLDTGCYQFFQDNKNWSDAQTACMERGGHLAELTGFDKQTDVVSLYSDGGHSPACFWIGGSERNKFKFTWNTSGIVMKTEFTEWESGYPKNRSVSTCVDFCHPDFSWKNKDCAQRQNYLCEFG